VVVAQIEKNDYLTLISIWEASVRVTHDFLSENDIAELKPLILEHYFDAVELRCAKDDGGEILGFCGVAEGNIEMLFVAPEARGKGVGALLCNYAIKNQLATKVDVNEQNPQAIGFYQYMGFKIVRRSETDGQGKPFPLLHMRL
jgi:putative acetyltransferase